ncbi:hypothetical protein C0Q70_05192 [Pomacea canaliculata]|uniref:Mitogen-activated protein kinase kinase kinase 19 n=1 Tax=Pomacea canaliculata TaxID=400727 RepID=A0A2T7PKJ6_POMCA|nr:hypothetical protein C0Q70_05192 [Pomacea canaliculata]
MLLQRLGHKSNVANTVVKSMQNSSTAQGAPFSGKGQLVIMRDSFQNVSSMSSTSETVCLQKQIKNLDKKLEDDTADSSQIVLGSGVGSVEAGAAVRERKDVTVKPSSGDVVSLIQNVPGPCVSETYPKNSERKETGGSKVCDTSKPSVGSKTNDYSKPGVFSRSGISSSYSSLTPSSAVSKSMKHFNKDVSKKVSNKIKETASTSTSPKTCSDTIKSASKSSNIVSSVSHSSVPRPVSSAILLSSFESTSESNIASSLQTKSPSSENLSSHMPAPSAEKKPAEVTARCKTSESTQKKDGVTAGGAKYCSANTRATLARGLEGNSRSPASSECKNAKIPPTNLCQTSCPEPSQKVSSDLASSKASSLATSSSACVTALTEKNTNKVERDVMKGSSLGPSSAKSKNITKNSQGSMCTEPGSRRTVTPSSSQGTILMKDTQMSSEITSGRKTSASQGEPSSRQANLAKAASADPPAHKTTNTADGAICRPQASLVNSDYSHGTQSKMAPTKKSEHSFLSKAVPEDKISKNQAEVQKDDKNEHDIEPLVKITFGKIDSRAAAALRCPSDPAVFKSTPVIVNPFEHLPVCQSVKDNCPRHVTMAEKPSKDAGLCKGKKGKPSRSTKRGREKRPVSGSSRQASAGRRGRKSREGKASEGVESRPRSGKTIGRARSGKRRTKKQADKQEDTEDNLAEVATKGDVALISGIGWHLATPCVDTSDIHAASSIHYSSSDFEDSDDTESVADDDKVCEYLDVRQGQVSTSPRFREVKGEGGKADVTIPVMLNDGFPPMNLDMTLMNSNARPQNNGVRSTSSDAEDNGAKVSAVLNDELADLEHIRDITTKDMLLGKLTPIPEIPSLSGVCEAIARFDHCLKEGQLSQLLEGAVQEKKDSALPYTKGGNDSSSCGPEMDLQTRKLNNSGLNLLESASTMDVCAKQNFERDPENTHIIFNEDSTENKVKKERKFSESKKDEEEINIAIDEILSATSTSMSSTLKSTSTLRSGAVTFTEGDHRLLAKLKSQNKDSPFYAHRENSPEDEPKTPGGGTKGKGVTNAQADRNEIQSLWTVEEEAKQLIKVMNSFRHMELHAGGSPHLREPVVTSDSHRVVKVASAQDRAKGIEDPNVAIGAQGGYEDVVEALAGDITHNALVNTAVSETMCSRLSGRRGSRSSSASTTDSTEETIQWKKGNVLGKGAFGTVWCGLTNEGELIAVKQIELTTTDRCKAEFEYEKVQEEVELLKTLSHTNIVGYLGTSFEDNIVSIFMQFVPGGSIASILARFGALDEAVFRRYTRQILQGVEYLHSNDVIHRDIKGGNVMLMPNGVIKLIDFGCAKRLCINLSLSQTQILRSMKGTPYWMAPEVVNESGHGKKSDIWSIGCTVFEMATRKPPWAEMNPMAAIFAIGSDKPVPKLPNRFSLEAISFTERCLTRDQTQRPSASELLTDSFMLERIPKK